MKVYVIVLNYKNWQDSLECVLSLQELEYSGEIEIVLVDNHSQNNSVAFLQEKLQKESLSRPVHMLALEENGGFSKGNNAGLRYAIEKGDGAYFWVLNNDTTVDKKALLHLLEEAEAHKKQNKKIGIYGTKLRYYTAPELLQAVGGSYNKWLATLKEVGNLEVDKGQHDSKRFPNVLVGASLFVSSEFLEDVGLLGEDYFIYFEEEDWAERARRKGWGLCVVPESIVYHKQGVTTNANGLNNDQKSRFSDFYYFKNRLLITYKFFPYCLPTVILSFFFSAVNRIKRKQWDRLGMMLTLIFTFRSAKWEG